HDTSRLHCHVSLTPIPTRRPSDLLYSLISYRTTTRTFEKKLVELTKAEEIRNKVKALPDPNHPYDIKVLSDRIVEARKAARDYEDRKSTRLNSSHQIISYAVFCLR